MNLPSKKHSPTMKSLQLIQILACFSLFGMTAQTIQAKTTKAPAKVSSAWHGLLPCEYKDGEAVITLPSLDAVDLLRIDSNQ